MKTKELQKKIEELEERIKQLESKTVFVGPPQYVPYPVVQPQITPFPWLTTPIWCGTGEVK